MESGVVHTAAFARHAHLSFGTIYASSWWSENLNPGTVNWPVVDSFDAWNALTDEDRAALDGSIDEAIAHYLTTYGKVLSK